MTLLPADEAKAAGKFTLSMGVVPILTVTEGGSSREIAQSHAISRFLAKRFGLMGDSDIEAALIDMASSA